MRMMFETTAASYSYQNMGDQEYLHITIMAINVFVGNILLLNYLVAIMSTTYGLMLESGSFLFKVNLYNYCERYMIGFHNKAYGELVLHPAPISLLTAPMVICLFLPANLLEKVFEGFSHFMYWLENLIFVCMFFCFEILLVPAVYFKNFIVIIWASNGLFTTIFYSLFWILGGIPLSLYIAVRDVWYFLEILAMPMGCRQSRGLTDELQTEEPDFEMLARVYNEARETVIEKYEEIKLEVKGVKDEVGEKKSIDGRLY